MRTERGTEKRVVRKMHNRSSCNMLSFPSNFMNVHLSKLQGIVANWKWGSLTFRKSRTELCAVLVVFVCFRKRRVNERKLNLHWSQHCTNWNQFYNKVSHEYKRFSLSSDQTEQRYMTFYWLYRRILNSHLNIQIGCFSLNPRYYESLCFKA